MINPLAQLHGDDAKQERFELSTLTAVLKQLGANKARIQAWRRQLAEAFNLEWLYQSRFIEPRVVSGRCFTYQILDLFRNPEKCPLIKLWDAVEADLSENGFNDPFIMVFGYDGKRLILTNDIGGEFRPHISPRKGLHVVDFLGYFSSRFGSDVIDNDTLGDH